MSRLKTLLCTLLIILPTAIAQAGDDGKTYTLNINHII